MNHALFSIAALRLQSLARSPVATTTGGRGSIMIVGITMIMMVAAAMVMTGMVSGGSFGLDRQGLKR